jgi:hypothetical protein
MSDVVEFYVTDHVSQIHSYLNPFTCFLFEYINVICSAITIIYEGILKMCTFIMIIT